MNVPVRCCRGGVYFKRAILWRSSWRNGVDRFEAVSRESLKYSLASESGVPKTSSAGEHPMSSLTVFLHARRIRGNSFTQFVESVLAAKEVFKHLWNLSSTPLACRLYMFDAEEVRKFLKEG